jgi:hypothetical protein
VNSLADEYTARELAEKLSAAESRARRATRRFQIAFDALRGIARSEWTADGARKVASAAIEEMKHM